jgi:hypothetical protein
MNKSKSNQLNQQEQATLIDLAGKKLSLKEISYIMKHSDNGIDINDANNNAYEQGKADRKAEVAELLLDKCRQGDTRAIIFYLKCHGWVEGKNVDITNSDGSLVNSSASIASLVSEINSRQ